MLTYSKDDLSTDDEVLSEQFQNKKDDLLEENKENIEENIPKKLNYSSSMLSLKEKSKELAHKDEDEIDLSDTLRRKFILEAIEKAQNKWFQLEKENEIQVDQVIPVCEMPIEEFAEFGQLFPRKYMSLLGSNSSFSCIHSIKRPLFSSITDAQSSLYSQNAIGKIERLDPSATDSKEGPTLHNSEQFFNSLQQDTPQSSSKNTNRITEDASRLRETLQTIRMLNKTSAKAKPHFESSFMTENDKNSMMSHVSRSNGSTAQTVGEKASISKNSISPQSSSSSPSNKDLKISFLASSASSLPSSVWLRDLERPLLQDQPMTFNKSNININDAYVFFSNPFFNLSPLSGPHQVKQYDFSSAEWTKSLFDGREKKDIALYPFINENGLKQLYSIQRQYLAKVNELVDQTEYIDKTLFNIVQMTQGDITHSLLHQYASQAWNLDFFLSILRSGSDTLESKSITMSPSTEMAARITNSFGSLNHFKEQFEMIATAFFGSGWIWLIETNTHDLQLITTMPGASPLQFPKDISKFGNESKFLKEKDHSNNNRSLEHQNKPTLSPLIGLSLWEHAYLWTHPSKESYVKSFWRALDWKKVESFSTFR